MLSWIKDDERTSVSDQYPRVLESFGTVDTNGLVEDEALVQIRVRQFASDFFDDLNMI